MKTLIYYRYLKDTYNYSFQNPLTDWVKENFQYVNIFDIDQQSASEIWGYAKKLAESAEVLVLVVDVPDEGQVKNVNLLADIVEGFRDKMFICLKGNHAMVAKVLRIVGPEKFKRTETLEDQKQFLKTVLRDQQ